MDRVREVESPHPHDHLIERISQRSIPKMIAKASRSRHITVDRVIRQYLQRIPVDISDASRTPPQWPDHIKRAHDCHDYLMQSGIADLTFASNKAVLPIPLGLFLLQCAHLLDDGQQLRQQKHLPPKQRHQQQQQLLQTRSALVDNIVEALRIHVPDTTNSNVLFIPICHQNEWGCVIITLLDHPPRHANIRWGDSLRKGPPSNLMQAVCVVLEKFYPSAAYIPDHDIDYMLDTNRFPLQNNSFSSGFYVLSLLSMEAERSRYLPRRPVFKYDIAHFEQIRDACIASYFHFVLALHRKSSTSSSDPCTVNDGDVYDFLIEGIDSIHQLERDSEKKNLSEEEPDEHDETEHQHGKYPDGTTNNHHAIGLASMSNVAYLANPSIRPLHGSEMVLDVDGRSIPNFNSERHTVQPDDHVEGGDGAEPGEGTEDEPKTTVLVHDIVSHYQQLASQGFFFGNTSHQGLKGRSCRGQKYRAYIQLRCIKYPGDRKRDIPKCKAKLRYDKLRDQQGWHASLFSEHSHPPLPEKLRSRRESQVIQTLKDVQIWYLPKNLLPRPVIHMSSTEIPDRMDGGRPGSESNIALGKHDQPQRPAAEKILPRPPHLGPDGHPMHPMLVPRIARLKNMLTSPSQPSLAPMPVHSMPVTVFPPHAQVPIRPSHSHSLTPSQQPPAHPGRGVILIAPRNLRGHVDPLRSVSPVSKEVAMMAAATAASAVVPISAIVPVGPAASASAPEVGQSDSAPSSAAVPSTQPSTDIVDTTSKSIHDGSTELQQAPQITNQSNNLALAGHHMANGQEGKLGKLGTQPSEANMDILVVDGDGDTGATHDSQQLGPQLLPVQEPMEAAFRNSGEDLVALKNGGATLALVEAIRAYVNTSHMKLAENEMAHHIKKIAEQCGYKLRIRRSMYHAGQENIFIKSATFECAQKVRHSCPFAFRLRGHLKRRRSDESSGAEASHSDENGTPKSKPKQAVYTTSVNFLKESHNHEHDSSLLQKHIPVADSAMQPVALAREGNMTVGNVIRHVEKKHSFMVPRVPLRKRIAEERETNDPLARQCNALVAKLMDICNDEVGMFTHFSMEGRQNTLSRLCWCFSEWKDEFMLHGLVPGVYIDTKELADLFKLPLVSINGRTNTGDTVIFFMAFIAEQNEDSMTWMLQQFKRCMSEGECYTPKVVSVDQCAMTIAAVRAALPSSWILIDESLHTHTERENVTKFLTGMDMTHMTDEMNSRLRELRSARSHEEFLMLRKGFEGTFFSHLGDNDHPEWYKLHYYTEKEVVVHCFNQRACGLRFAFNGLGYTELLDCIHKLEIEDTSVESHKVPLIVRQAAIARRGKQEKKRRAVSSSLADMLFAAGLYSTEQREEVGMSFVEKYTEFCVRHFLDEVVEAANSWRVRMFNVVSDQMEGNVTVTTVCFRVCKVLVAEESEVETVPNVEHEVFVMRRCFPNDADTLASTCACEKGKMSGMPCAHQVTVIRSYNGCNEEFSVARSHLNTTVLPLAYLFHDYWKRDQTSWRDMVVKTRMDATVNVQVDDDGDRTATIRMRETLEANRDERRAHCAYNMSKELFNQSWNETVGREQKEVFHSSMAQFATFCRQKRVGEVAKALTDIGREEQSTMGTDGGVGVNEESTDVDGERRGEKRSGSGSAERSAQRRRTSVGGGSGDGVGGVGGESGVGEFSGSNYVQGSVFGSELTQLGEDGGQRSAFTSTAAKSMFESVMRRMDG